MQAPDVDHWNVVIQILRYIKDFRIGIVMRINEIPESLGIVMLIGLDTPYTECPLLDIVYLLEAILSLGRARSKTLLLGLVQKQNMELWPQPLVS